MALTRQMMWRMLGADHPMEAHRQESRILLELGRSTDVKEGVTSFLEKRPAQFAGKVSSDMPAVFPWWIEQSVSLTRDGMQPLTRRGRRGACLGSRGRK
jgi:hypothetical protein